MNRRYFTLIELLIVVAIISILAAIAVPNMLEAMVRSKVSRSKSDLRSLSTAIESYYVDHNSYPPDSSFGTIPFLQRLKHLTTPVAYMTSVPGDPFADVGSIRVYSADKGRNAYTVDGSVGGAIVHPLTYDFAWRRLPNGTYEPKELWEKITQHPESVQWAMRGIGPSKWPAWLGDPEKPYDPTNGTVSAGNLFWTGPGVGPDQPRQL